MVGMVNGWLVRTYYYIVRTYGPTIQTNDHPGGDGPNGPNGPHGGGAIPTIRTIYSTDHLEAEDGQTTLSQGAVYQWCTNGVPRGGEKGTQEQAYFSGIVERWTRCTKKMGIPPYI